MDFTTPLPPSQTYDALIIGAGISGLTFAYRLSQRHPSLRYLILESRPTIGGTWSFFRYPGLRSDSDLYTFGFPWRPWDRPKAIAEAALIREYLRESCEEAGLAGRDYKEPLRTVIPGIETFKGPVVHPQFWPEDLDYADKHTVIIGSGATAITILPAMAKTAKMVTMLQRSPGYIMSNPDEDWLERLIRRWFPKLWSHQMIRWKWLISGFFMIRFCKWFPSLAKKMLRDATVAELPKNIEYDPHFKPNYEPLDQRMCLCPNGDYFEALRSGKADVVTGVIDRVRGHEIVLKDGRVLKPDIIVTATGLKVQFGGNIRITVDGKPYKIYNSKYMWKNTMLQDLPNAIYGIGYVDAAWTLGADSSAQLFCRILDRMNREGATVCIPTIEEGTEPPEGPPLFNLSSSYVKAGKSAFPKTGMHPQWKGRNSYLYDIYQAWYGDITTGMKYLKPVTVGVP